MKGIITINPLYIFLSIALSQSPIDHSLIPEQNDHIKISACVPFTVNSITEQTIN